MSEKSTGMSAESSLEISRQLSAAAREGEQLSAAFRTITQSVNMCADGLQVMQTVTEGALDVSRFKEYNVALSEMEREQESLNTAIEGSAAAADGLLKKIGGVITKFASWDNLEKIAGLSDSVMQTTAKLDMMNDGFRTTQELQDMVYAAAQNSRSSYSQMASDIIGLGNTAKDSFANNDEIVAFAELVSKQFAIAGISGQDASDAFAQLSQAMGEGALSGAQLEEIYNAAPNLIQDIADYMGVPIEKMGEMAASGEITSQAIKNAMFSASDEINGKFAQLPLTWQDIATGMKNVALKAFEPLLIRINELANDEKFQSFVNGMVNALYTLSDIAVVVFDGLATAAAFVYDNWDLIGPVIYGLVTAFTVYALIQGVSALLSAANTIAIGLQAIGMMALAFVTGDATAMQMGLNLAMSAFPGIWIIAIIAGIIVAIIAFISNTSEAGATVATVFSSMCGNINIALQFFKNLGMEIANVAIGIWNAINTVASNIPIAFHNGLQNAKAFFYNFAAGVIEIIGNIASALNKLPFVSFDTSGIYENAANYKAKAEDALNSKKEYNSVSDAFGKGINTFDVFNDGWKEDAYSDGYNFGSGIANKISDRFKKSGDAADGAGGFMDNLGSVSDNIGTVSENTSLSADNTASAADSTGSIADSMEITQEDLKYLRDIAEREVIDRTTFKDISVNLGGISNIVNSMSDLDGIADYLGNVICEQMLVSAEGI